VTYGLGDRPAIPTRMARVGHIARGVLDGHAKKGLRSRVCETEAAQSRWATSSSIGLTILVAANVDLSTFQLPDSADPPVDHSQAWAP